MVYVSLINLKNMTTFLGKGVLGEGESTFANLSPLVLACGSVLCVVGSWLFGGEGGGAAEDKMCANKAGRFEGGHLLCSSHLASPAVLKPLGHVLSLRRWNPIPTTKTGCIAFRTS